MSSQVCQCTSPKENTVHTPNEAHSARYSTNPPEMGLSFFGRGALLLLYSFCLCYCVWINFRRVELIRSGLSPVQNWATSTYVGYNFSTLTEEIDFKKLMVILLLLLSK